MDFLLLIVIAALGYAVIRQNKTNNSTPPPEQTSDVLSALPPGYNPYILNQFNELKDRIFSADLRENRIETKPSINATGIYGITENQIKMHPYDSITLTYTPKHTLNV